MANIKLGFYGTGNALSDEERNQLIDELNNQAIQKLQECPQPSITYQVKFDDSSDIYTIVDEDFGITQQVDVCGMTLPNVEDNGDFSASSIDWNEYSRIINSGYFDGLENINKEDNVKNKIRERMSEICKDWQDLRMLIDDKNYNQSVADKFGIKNDVDIEKAKTKREELNLLQLGYQILIGMNIANIIDNNPHTIVQFSDGTKIVNKASDDDIYDVEKGVLLALVKKPDVLDSYQGKTYSYEMFAAINDFLNR